MIRKGSWPWVRGLAIGAIAVASIVGAPGAMTAQSPDAGGSAAASVVPVGSIRLGAFRGIDGTPVFVAFEQGIFEKNGLDVQETYVSTGLEIVNSIVAGDLDIGSAAPLVALSSVQQGIPIRVVAFMHGNAASDRYGSESIIASGASGVAAGDVAGLRGKKIGFPFGTNAHAYILGALNEAGLTADDVELINVAPGDVLTALAEGSIDAFVLWEPNPTIALDQVEGSVRVQRAVESSPGYFPGIVITSEQLAHDKAAEIQAYLASIAEAQQWIRANPEAAAETATRWIPNMSKEVALEAFNSLILDSRLSKLALGALESNTMQRLIDLDLVEAPIPLDQWVYPDLSKAVQDSHPELFSDLTPIPEGQGL